MNGLDSQHCESGPFISFYKHFHRRSLMYCTNPLNQINLRTGPAEETLSHHAIIHFVVHRSWDAILNKIKSAKRSISKAYLEPKKVLRKLCHCYDQIPYTMCECVFFFWQCCIHQRRLAGY